ncbi:MAG: sensor histidine kinase, partial [Chloroflexota bacterium]|nr:sensor histidine kinase [Chloroflexota bacterium]
DQTLRLIIEDDGKGFDVEAALQRAVEGKSLGLLSMQDRAKQVGGWLKIESIPASGTKIHVQIPISLTEEGPLPA